MNALDYRMRSVPAVRFGPHLLGAPATVGYDRKQLSEDAVRRIPELNPNHYFPADVYRDLVAWWNLGGREPLLISGPAGSGKTSTVLQFCARLSVPVVCFTARPRMGRRELIGRWVLGKDGMVWVDGPATLAWRHGWLFIVNESSAAPAETWVSANDLLEGLALENDQTGEVIPRHPMARIVFTDNCRGHATETDSGYLGRQMQDRSVIDRMWHIRMEGLTETEEASVLANAVPRALRGAAGDLVVNEIASFMAQAGAATRESSKSDTLGFRSRTIALSHRALSRMTTMSLSHVTGATPEVPDPLAWIADAAVGNALDRPVRDALVTYLKTLFGERLTEMHRAWLECHPSAPAQGLPCVPTLRRSTHRPPSASEPEGKKTRHAPWEPLPHAGLPARQPAVPNDLSGRTCTLLISDEPYQAPHRASLTRRVRLTPLTRYRRP
ncbi:AAA family ATPase [Sutterella sp.]|uniref:AAA family ATPase n=1 Tax=Sutterella sp. TaxID=1981025 RepID=UPI0026DF170A|nr:AAA family ATPase [Sutterella sp.]MDO5531742.1 AAA family ATPase [Sutterella sp.]